MALSISPPNLPGLVSGKDLPPLRYSPGSDIGNPSAQELLNDLQSQPKRYAEWTDLWEITVDHPLRPYRDSSAHFELLEGQLLFGARAPVRPGTENPPITVMNHPQMSLFLEMVHFEQNRNFSSLYKRGGGALGQAARLVTSSRQGELVYTEEDVTRIAELLKLPEVAFSDVYKTSPDLFTKNSIGRYAHLTTAEGIIKKWNYLGALKVNFSNYNGPLASPTDDRDSYVITTITSGVCEVYNIWDANAAAGANLWITLKRRETDPVTGECGPFWYEPMTSFGFPSMAKRLYKPTCGIDTLGVPIHVGLVTDRRCPSADDKTRRTLWGVGGGSSKDSYNAYKGMGKLAIVLNADKRFM